MVLLFAFSAALALSPPTRGANGGVSDVLTARTFAEPLVALGAPDDATPALRDALAAYRSGGDSARTEPLERFLAAHPESVWAPSLSFDLGVVYRQVGALSRALVRWEWTWGRVKNRREPAARRIGDDALAELAELTAALGRTERLRELLREADERSFTGRAEEQIAGARRGLWLMESQPEIAFRCGPLALEQMSRALEPGRRATEAVLRYPSTPDGTSLAEIGDLAARSGLTVRILRRSPGSKIAVPSVVHWKTGHFAAVTAERSGSFLVKDLTFGEDRWVRRAVLEDESDGYMLAPASLERDAEWRPVDASEAAGVRGRGATGNPNPGGTRPPDGKKPKPPCGSGRGMPEYDFHLALVSLDIVDEPVGYSPPRGSRVSFQVTYNSREASQPDTFTFSNLGVRWTHNWLSFVQDDPTAPGGTVRVIEAGGGYTTFSNYDPGTGTYGASAGGYHDTLTASFNPTIYTRVFPDNSRWVYSDSDGGASTRRVFLSSVVDPAGNAVTLHYDASMRLTRITDALGQTSTLAYGLASDPLKVTSVRDPFGRTATLQYDGTGKLASITDAIGMTTTFAYGPTNSSPAAAPDFLNAMTTPYGTTTFDETEAYNQLYGYTSRSLLATDPMGNQERIEFVHAPCGTSAPTPCGIDPTTTEPVPQGFTNDFLEFRNTFYWDQRAMSEFDPNDPQRYLKATYVYHWLHDGTGATALASLYPESIVRQGERRTWFAYPGQADDLHEGTISLPSVTARVLDDGREQRTTVDYLPFGLPQSLVDPVGRTYRFLYSNYAIGDPQGVDLTEIDHVLASGTVEKVAGLGYDGHHNVTSYTDYAGKTYTATYNAFGQITSLLRPDGQKMIANYDGQGFLTSITRQGTSYQETFTYDATDRVRTWTAADGYVLTFDYDNLDRLTAVTYPDGTTETATFDRLDPVESKDRLGRITRTRFDLDGNPIESIDPDGRSTSFSWCGCGTLEEFVNARGVETDWLRDALGRVVGKFRNGILGNSFDYDSAGRLVRRTDALGQITDYAYSPDDALTGVVYSQAVHATPNASIDWDPDFSRPTRIADGTGVTAIAYVPALQPGAGQVSTITGAFPLPTIALQYDALGRLATRTIDGVAATQTYDALDRLARDVNPLGTFTPVYSGATDRIQSLTMPNGVGALFSYAGAAGDFRLTNLSFSLSGKPPISQFAFAYGPGNEQLTSMTVATSANPTGYNRRLTFDPAGQLTEALDRPAGGGAALHDETFGYDLAGNRVTDTRDGTSTVVDTDELDQVTAVHRGLSAQAMAAIRKARAARKTARARKDAQGGGR